ncbi:hypothetical protein SCB71_20410 [Herbiconiux sp. KACC 21604]|uniref:hypothetical protein n=1 Tax=unclassified Herbiconiux TaxID=2618217 RepID=UPI0014929221|nr:hypothetical protein [Herbiconiux sp. SALV-R1]QJU55386.1 hypothetical protein HL652_18335 [Herbiconiux sp. SALV-R1]WPO86559.1 hypothetical protein SCB71_20410 [Herbiconiux sp. KACC 21604]
MTGDGPPPRPASDTERSIRGLLGGAALLGLGSGSALGGVALSTADIIPPVAGAIACGVAVVASALGVVVAVVTLRRARAEHVGLIAGAAVVLSFLVAGIASAMASAVFVVVWVALMPLRVDLTNPLFVAATVWAVALSSGGMAVAAAGCARGLSRRRAAGGEATGPNRYG